MAERAGQEASSLSGGQQQTLALASALVASPVYLLVDELLIGLAPVVVQRLVPGVRAIAARGIGVLLVEQFASVAPELATHAVVLERGEISFDGPAQTLLGQPELLHSAYLAR